MTLVRRYAKQKGDPHCGRGKRPILLLLPHHTALVILVCVPATNEMLAWQAFLFSAVPRTTTYFLLPFPALARLAERIGWSQTSPYGIVRSPIVRLCALNAPTLASLTDGSRPRLRRGQQHAAWRRLRACEVTEGVFIRTPLTHNTAAHLETDEQCSPLQGRHIVRRSQTSPCVILSGANVPVARCEAERAKTCNKLLVLASKMRQHFGISQGRPNRYIMVCETTDTRGRLSLRVGA